VSLPYTEQDWFLFIQSSHDIDHYELVVIRGPVPTQILQQRLQKILDNRPLETAVFLFETIKVIIFQQPLNIEQIKILQGDISLEQL